ncbi:hypothetical protein J6P11_05210 [bacterium]|nr:hypothetical protein [bacterium]
MNINIKTKEELINVLKENNLDEPAYKIDNLFKIYSAIYDRTLEVFFKPAKYNQTILTFKNKLKNEFNNLSEVLFNTNSKILIFDG